MDPLPVGAIALEDRIEPGLQLLQLSERPIGSARIEDSSAWPPEYVDPQPDQSPAGLRDPRLPERDRNRQKENRRRQKRSPPKLPSVVLLEAWCEEMAADAVPPHQPDAQSGAAENCSVNDDRHGLIGVAAQDRSGKRHHRDEEQSPEVEGDQPHIPTPDVPKKPVMRIPIDRDHREADQVADIARYLFQQLRTELVDLAWTELWNQKLNDEQGHCEGEDAVAER